MSNSTARKILTMFLMISLLLMTAEIVVADTNLDVPLYKQGDEPWYRDKLGTTSMTIKSDGCAITSISMVLKYYGVQTNPRDLNIWLTKQKNGYVTINKIPGNVNWAKAAEISKGTVSYVQTVNYVDSKNKDIPADLNKINSELDKGYPVIAKVLMPKYGTHFIVITGYSGSTYYINDPIYGKSVLSDNYGKNPANAIRGIRIYHGTPDVTLKPEITSITPTQTVAGTFDLTITGKNFDSKTAVERIYFNGNYVGQGTIKSRSSTKIVVTEKMTGTTPGVYVVRVRNNPSDSNTESNGKDLTITAPAVPKPEITSITPTQTVAGTFDLTITGKNFDSKTAVERIYFNGNYVGQGTIKSRSSTKIVVTEKMTGTTPGVYVVRVRNNPSDSNTESNGKDLTITAPAVPKPEITSITPTQTVAGTFDLTITGKNFDSKTAVERIYFNGNYVGQGTIKSRSSTKIVVTEKMTGTTPGVYVVRVRNSPSDSNTESNGKDLTITAPEVPVTLSISPTSGQQGTTFTFSGTGYTPNGVIEWHVKRPDNSEITPSTFKALSIGALSKSYTSSTTDMVGTYTIWAIDKATGRQSKYVTETITAAPVSVSVQYQGQFAYTGWGDWAQDGNTAGTPSSSANQMEAIKIKTSNYGVIYRAHVADVGWQSYVSNGQIAGTVGQGKSLQAIQIQLQNAPSNMHVKYRAYVNGAWQSWVSDGATAGTTGLGLPVKAIQIQIYTT